MTKRELIDYCLTYADAVEDYPFEDSTNAVLRHRGNGKWFALICEPEGRLCVNLKCEPVEADFLRKTFRGVRPAWHMNKVHWNTVELGSDVPEAELFAMIRASYELTAPGPGRRARPKKEGGAGK